MASAPISPAGGPHRLIAALLLGQPRDQLEALAEAVIAVLDTLDGDDDLESPGLEDDFEIPRGQLAAAAHGPGCNVSDPDYGVDDQGEAIDEREPEEEDGRVLSYEIDQTNGTIVGMESDTQALREQKRHIWRTRCYKRFYLPRGAPPQLLQHLLSTAPVIPTSRQLFRRKRGIPKRPRP